LFGEAVGGSTNVKWQIRKAGADGVLAEGNDDNRFRKELLHVLSLDPRQEHFTAPEDGRYLLRVTSKRGFFEAGPRHYYRLCLTPEPAGFELIAQPIHSQPGRGGVLHPGGQMQLLIFVRRSADERKEIQVTAKNLPAGVACPPLVIPASQMGAVLTLHAAGNAPEWTGAIEIWGTAALTSGKMERKAHTATPVWPAAGDSPTRLMRSLMLAVRK
jgi:hypothetical protein